DVLAKSSFKELILFDRGYPSFDLMHTLMQSKVSFVMRSKETFNAVVKRFYDSTKEEDIIEIGPGKNEDINGKKYGRNDKITVRVIKVLLSNGEIEILITSLTDRKTYPASDFKALYF